MYHVQSGERGPRIAARCAIRLSANAGTSDIENDDAIEQCINRFSRRLAVNHC